MGFKRRVKSHKNRPETFLACLKRATGQLDAIRDPLVAFETQQGTTMVATIFLNMVNATFDTALAVFASL